MSLHTLFNVARLKPKLRGPQDEGADIVYLC